MSDVTRRLLPVAAAAAVLALLAAPVSAQTAQRGLPSRTLLDRFGLERAWTNQATIDVRSDVVRHLVADEEVVIVQARSGLITVFDAQSGVKLWDGQLARADSLYAAFDSLRARNQLLGNALTGAQSETARLRSRLRRADASGAVLQAIRDSLAALDATRSRLHAAAAMDVAQIARRGDSGVVVLVITWPDGTVRTASAIAAERRGRPVLVTTRAVTVDPDGKAASLAVVVPGTGDVKPTRVTSVNPTLDLALLDAPAGVRPRNTAPLANAEQIRAASVAVMVGYPANAARSADAGTPPPGSSVAALGSVTFSGGNDMELQPYGLTLAPGTAVLDADGRVIGIVLGFARDPQRLRALPATAVSRFLAEGSGAS